MLSLFAALNCNGNIHWKRTNEVHVGKALCIIQVQESVYTFAINVSTELEMTPDARQNGGKDRYVKYCKCA